MPFIGLQWGYSSVSDSESSVSVNFPITYKTNCFLVVAGTKVDSGYPDIMAQNTSFTTSKATFFLNKFNDYTGTIKVAFIAMGCIK